MVDHTKIYVNPNFSNQDLVDLIHNTVRKIKNKPDMPLPQINIGTTEFGGHFFMIYTRDTKQDLGMLMISEGHLGGIPVKFISGEAKKPEQKLFEHIADSIGGIIKKSESSEQLINYEVPENFLNIDFLLKKLKVGGPYYNSLTKENQDKLINELTEELLSLKKDE